MSEPRGTATFRYISMELRTWDVLAEAGLQLAPSPAALYLRLATGPESTRVPGVLRVGRAALAEALGWSPRQLTRCMDSLEDAGLVRADWSARVVYLPQVTAQPCSMPTSPSAAAMYGRELADLPRCQVVADVERDLVGAMMELGRAFYDSYAARARRDEKRANTKADQAQPAGQLALLPAAQGAEQATSLCVSPLALALDPHQLRDPDPALAPPPAGASAPAMDSGTLTADPPQLTIGRTLPEFQAYWAERTGILTPNPYDLKEAHGRIALFAATAGMDGRVAQERALDALERIVGSWSDSTHKGLTPQRLLSKWDEIQPIVLGKVKPPAPRAGNPMAIGERPASYKP